MAATTALKIGDQVQCLDTDTSFYVESFHPVEHHKVYVTKVNNSRAGFFCVPVKTLVKFVHGKPRHVHVPQTTGGRRAKIVPARQQPRDVAPRVELRPPSEDDMAYNRRKDRANAVFFAKFRQLVSEPEVRALLLDAPPRGVSGKKPNTTEFLIEKKRVPPSNIVVVNPSAAITEKLVEMGVGAYQELFNDFIMEMRPDFPFNYLYLDACGFYRKQLRRGLREIFENHERWLADEALLNIVISKRNGKDVLEKVKKDLEKWSIRCGYGNVLSTLTDPDNKRMYTATFYLKRSV